MGFHRGSFYIAKYDGGFELKEGWIDETNTYGFYKIQKKNVTTILKWVCTDLNSGLRICSAATRKACCEWVLRNQDRICAQKNKDAYKSFVNKLKGSKEVLK